jgi:hypothetical protein
MYFEGWEGGGGRGVETLWAIFVNTLDSFQSHFALGYRYVGAGTATITLFRKGIKILPVHTLKYTVPYSILGILFFNSAQRRWVFYACRILSFFWKTFVLSCFFDSVDVKEEC